MEAKIMQVANGNDLDWHAARAAQIIVKNTQAIKVKKNGRDEPIEASSLDNLSTKTLGILQENGVYAALLYLFSRSESERLVAEQLRGQLLPLTLLLLPTLKEKKEITDKIEAKNVPAEVALDFLTEYICNDLDILLLVKQLWEQTLIYTRYGAKAWDVEVEAKRAREREEAEKAKKAQEEAEKEKTQT
jgi:hypothetical protein